MLTSRFQEALAMATELHLHQLRKGTPIPYVAHLLNVAGLALTHGADEDVAIAALLHDAVEDAGGAPTLARLRERFGDRVADLVAECSDTDESPKPPWRERKESYVARLPEASDGALLVSACDKLDNARSTLADYRTMGETLWGRFRGARDGTLWYYRTIIEVYRATGRVPAPLVDELDRVVGDLEDLARAARS